MNQGKGGYTNRKLLSGRGKLAIVKLTEGKDEGDMCEIETNVILNYDDLKLSEDGDSIG